jgi:hypothetical protein
MSNTAKMSIAILGITLMTFTPLLANAQEIATPTATTIPGATATATVEPGATIGTATATVEPGATIGTATPTTTPPTATATAIPPTATATTIPATATATLEPTATTIPATATTVPTTATATTIPATATTVPATATPGTGGNWWDIVIPAPEGNRKENHGWFVSWAAHLAKTLDDVRHSVVVTFFAHSDAGKENRNTGDDDGNTPVATATSTGSVPSATPTSTTVPATATATLPPTSTETPQATTTGTPVPPTATATTLPPTATATAIPESTATATATAVATTTSTINQATAAYQQDDKDQKRDKQWGREDAQQIEPRERDAAIDEPERARRTDLPGADRQQDRVEPTAVRPSDNRNQGADRKEGGTSATGSQPSLTDQNGQQGRGQEKETGAERNRGRGR